jgi:hypothetical protein
MKEPFVILVLLLTVFLPSSLRAKGITTRIVIEGLNLSAPIEITDPQIHRNFAVWTGPGTSLNESAAKRHTPTASSSAGPKVGLPNRPRSFRNTKSRST